ncbi:MAG TPA: DUF6585 family protein [Gemmataceae bacterium]|nr:DUF6585 family protein [Gemmataceae bacterium]
MNVVCPRCEALMQAPDDLAEATCLNCGQFLALAQTHVTAKAPTTATIRSSEALEWTPGQTAPRPDVLPAQYADWDEFRSVSPTVQAELLKLATCALPDMRGAALQRLPENLPPKVDEFGRPLATLTIPGEKRPVNYTVGIIIAVVGCLFLLAGGFELGTGRIQRVAPLLLLLVLVAIGVGIWYFFLRKPTLEVTVWIFENGLFLMRGPDVEACGWEDVADFYSDEYAGRHCYSIVTQLGCRLTLSTEISPEIMPLAEYIRLKIASAQFLPKLRKIFDGGRVSFGLLRLNRAGISGPIGGPWAQIARVLCDEKNLFLDIRGQETWHQVPLREISFVPLLMAIAHVMIEDFTRLPPN